MTKLQRKIRDSLKSTYTPNAAQLVDMNGFDEFEKEGALAFFGGESWKSVLEHLQMLNVNAIASADYKLEEWSVLRSNARYYYLRAYLEFLLRTLSERNPDEQYISEFFHQLYQTVYMYRSDACDDQQKALLQAVAGHTIEMIGNYENVDGWSDNIVENVSRFLSELGKYE